ncbi:MAG: hypothetical protein ABIN48_02275 [Ginsengibacter sp.]
MIIVFFGSVACQGQLVMDTDGLNNPDNVYLFSLKEYCNSLDTAAIKSIYVQRKNFIGDQWPVEINGFKIHYLTSEECKDLIKENGGNIILVGISPLEFTHDIFSVDVLLFFATYKKKAVHLINGGGLRVEFQYDSEQKGLVYSNKKWGGI